MERPDAGASHLKRPILGIGVVLFWLVMMALLARSELIGGLLRGDVVLDREGWSDQPTDNWLTIHGPLPGGAVKTSTQGAANAHDAEFGPRVGYAHMAQAPSNRNGAEGAAMTLDVQLTLQMLGRRAALELTGEAWRARHERRAEVEFAIRSGEANFQLSGTIIDDSFEAEINSGGETSNFTTTLSDNALFSSGFGTNLSFPKVELGEQIAIQSFDPMTLRPSRSIVKATSSTTLEIGGVTVPATRLDVRSSGLRTIAWVDSEGQVLQATTPLGLSLRKSTRDEALAIIPAADNATELLRITAVKPTGQRPTRGLQEMRVRLPGVEGFAELGTQVEEDLAGSQTQLAESATTALAIPLDWRQQHVDGIFTFTAATAPGVPGSHEAPTSEERAHYLSSDAFIQSGHERIQAQASAIVATSSDGVDSGLSTELAQSYALHDWVFEQLDKEPVLSLPSALEVLQSKRGDCNEHTILYTALARSIGLPTRVAIGLVWSDVYDGFYYHAWPEVWLTTDQAWIALDPTLGQRLADATHIKLLEGSIDRWTQLLPFIGQIEIEVASIQ